MRVHPFTAKDRSRCSRPSPTRPSSPSRTSACSRSSRRGTGELTEALAAADGHRPRSCRVISRLRRPISSRCWTPSPERPRGCATARRLSIDPSAGAAASCGRSPSMAVPRPGHPQPISGPPHVAARSRLGRCSSRTPFMSTISSPMPDDRVPGYGRSVCARCGHPHCAGGAAAPRRRVLIGAICCRSALEVRPFSRAADRAARDLRRPGGDRHRERAAVHGSSRPGTAS